jgi:Leucine-rich repeat (LRR) protein
MSSPYSKSVDITCDFEPHGRKAHFPTRRYDLSAFMQQNGNNINVFLINNCNFDTIPDGAFADLSIQSLILANNGLARITTNAFRDTKSLKRLILLESNLTTIEDDAFKWIRHDLNELQLADLDIPNDFDLDRFLMNENLINLKSLNVLKLVNMKLKEFKKQWVPLVQNVSYLSLTSNQIEHFHPDFFNSLPNLVSLELTNNSFKDLDSLLDALRPIKSSLKELKLDGNLIEKLNQFPDFDNLELLDLSNNKLETLDPFTFNRLKSLSFLNLESNQIRRISDDFVSNRTTKLVTLSLKNNFLTTVPSIFNFPKLKFLDLANQNGQMNLLPDFAFDRYTKNDSVISMNALSISLESNEITRFGNRALCSRHHNTSEIHNLMLSMASMRNINKCMLTQLKSSMISRVSLRVQPSAGVVVSSLLVSEYAGVCNCELKMFAARFNIELTGACLMVNLPCEASLLTLHENLCANSKFTCFYN